MCSNCPANPWSSQSRHKQVTGGSCLSPGVLARPPPALGVPFGPGCSEATPHRRLYCPQGGTAPSFQEPLLAEPQSSSSPARPCLSSLRSSCLPGATSAQCGVTAPLGSCITRIQPTGHTKVLCHAKGQLCHQPAGEQLPLLTCSCLLPSLPLTTRVQQFSKPRSYHL